jgi:hypothetical protein
MKLSRKLHRQIEIKIRQAMASEIFRQETAALPDPHLRVDKAPEAAASGNR